MADAYDGVNVPDATGYSEGSDGAIITLDLPQAPTHMPLVVLESILATTIPSGSGPLVISVNGVQVGRTQLSGTDPDYLFLQWGNGLPAWAASNNDGLEWGTGINGSPPPRPGTGGTYRIYGGSGGGETQQQAGQSFTVGATTGYSLRGVAFYCRRTGNPTDTLTCLIRDTAIGSGTLLGTSNAVPVVDINSGDGSWVYFTFATPVSLAASTKYFFELSRSGARSTTDYISVTAIQASAMANGGAYTMANTAWSAESGTDDLGFKTYGGVRVMLNVPALSTGSNMLVTYHYAKPSAIRG